MRTAKRNADNVSGWIMWLVAVVCFGPLTAVWLLGVLYSVLWLPMLVAIQLAPPSGRPDDWGEAMRSVLAVVAYVSAGGLGLIGLVRVLTLSRRERPESHRYVTIGMVAAGLTALLIFDLPMFGGSIADFSDSMGGVLVYLVLPFGGGTWILAKSWRFLLAAPVRSKVDEARRLEDPATRAR